MRVFISIELPDEIRKNIVRRLNELREAGSGVRWVEEKNLHVTLKFLGEVEDKQVENIIALATKAAAGIGSFKANFEGMGTFPSGKSPRVIWAGIGEGGEKLKRIAGSLEEHFSKAGCRSEEREFSSHVTIGRIKGNRGVDKLRDKIEGLKGLKFGEALIDRIQVMKSALTPKGSIYELLKEVRL